MEREIFDTTYPEEIFLLKHQPVVIINGPWEQLGETEREQLYKIIAALKTPIDSITILTMPTLNITAFKGKADQVIYFGELPAGVARYEVLESDGVSFICSESLTDLLVNKAARNQLWIGLRALFSI